MEQSRDNATNIVNGNVDEISRDELSSDRIFLEIGGFGLFQILVGLASGAALISASLTIYNFIFAADIPEYRWG